MEQNNAAADQPEQVAPTVDEKRALEREALRRRVRESLVRCPDLGISPQA